MQAVSGKNSKSTKAGVRGRSTNRPIVPKSGRIEFPPSKQLIRALEKRARTEGKSRTDVIIEACENFVGLSGKGKRVAH